MLMLRGSMYQTDVHAYIICMHCFINHEKCCIDYTCFGDFHGPRLFFICSSWSTESISFWLEIDQQWAISLPEFEADPAPHLARSYSSWLSDISMWYLWAHIKFQVQFGCAFADSYGRETISVPFLWQIICTQTKPKVSCSKQTWCNCLVHFVSKWGVDSKLSVAHSTWMNMQWT